MRYFRAEDRYITGRNGIFSVAVDAGTAAADHFVGFRLNIVGMLADLLTGSHADQMKAESAAAVCGREENLSSCINSSNRQCGDASISFK